MALQFRDITDWTPASISIVDKPSHPLAVFEVYENDNEFIKKYIDPQMEDDSMAQNNNPAPAAGETIPVSGSFFEKLFDKVIAKSEPVSEDDTNKEILEKLNAIEENQKKTDERLTALETPEPTTPEPTPGKEDKNDNGEGETKNNDGKDGDESNPIAETVELPLNDDGTLNLDDAAVAKYLPKNYTPTSQGVDPDLQRGTPSDKSFNERTGRDSNGMSW